MIVASMSAETTVWNPSGWLVDSHCHIDMPEFDADRSEVVARAREAGLAEMLVVGEVDESGGLARALRVADQLGLPVTAGVHPHPGEARDRADLRRRPRSGPRGALVAIGEVGLDFHYDYSPRDVQREVFRRRSAWRAKSACRSSSTRARRTRRRRRFWRTRRADETVAASSTASPGGPGAAPASPRARFLHFILGIMTFPRAEVIQQVARSVPEDRLLVETDAPFLAPPPHRGKRNEPAFVVEVARKLAALRGVTLEDVGRAAARNYGTLFRRALPGSR
jgi:TatD DNase family protein